MECLVPQSLYTVKPLTSPPSIGSTVLCCYNQATVLVSTLCTESSETVLNMYMCYCRESDVVSSDFVKKFDCTILLSLVQCLFCWHTRSLTWG